MTHAKSLKMKSIPSLFVLLAFPLSALAAGDAHPSPAQLPRPLTLNAAIAFATEHNPALLRTQEQIREQEGVLVTARAARLPTVTASGSASRTDENRLEQPGADDRSWSVDVSATQVLYAGGQLKAREQGQREQVLASRLAFTAAVNDTVLTVRQQFYAILLNRELIGVQEEALRVLEGERDNAKSRREAGTGSDFDLLRAEVAVANAKPALIRARNNYQLAQDELRATLGISSSDTTDLAAEGSLAVAKREVSLVAALSEARAHRPEVLRQEKLEKSADLDVDAAKSGYKPTVSAVGGYAWSRPSLTTTSGNLHGWSAGVQASWNLFDSRATAGRVVQARSRARQVRFGSDDVRIGVELDVRTAHANLKEALELLVAAEQVVAQAQESLRLSQSRYSSGVATQLDVLTAQSALTEARSNLAQAQHNHAVALASLDRATGVAVN